MSLDENWVTMRACAGRASSRYRSANTFAASDGGGKTLRILADSEGIPVPHSAPALPVGVPPNRRTEARKHPARRRDWWESLARVRELPPSDVVRQFRNSTGDRDFLTPCGNVRRAELLITIVPTPVEITLP